MERRAKPKQNIGYKAKKVEMKPFFFKTDTKHRNQTIAKLRFAITQAQKGYTEGKTICAKPKAHQKCFKTKALALSCTWQSVTQQSLGIQ